MKKIIQHGKQPEEIKIVKRFRCGYCNCVFETDEDEYKFVPYKGEELLRKRPWVGFYSSECPECGTAAKEIIMR